VSDIYYYVNDDTYYFILCNHGISLDYIYK